MILIYKTKPEHTEQIMFGMFGKYEQINKLGNIWKPVWNTDGKLIIISFWNFVGYKNNRNKITRNYWKTGATCWSWKI